MKFYQCLFIIVMPFISTTIQGQTASVIIPSNVSTGTLEKDILLNAVDRYSVTQQGQAKLDLSILFDGSFKPSKTPSAPTVTDPTVILIENLPPIHVQNRAWIGWSSRYWHPIKFKIEVYNTWSRANQDQWITIADIDNYSKPYFMIKIRQVIAEKIRFTFYNASGTNGRLQISELYFIHPEAAQAYDGLMVKYQPNGNVLLGKTSQSNTSYKLDVNGNIRANKVVVNTSGADYVFDSAYQLTTLDSLHNFIKKKHHLPGIPSAEDMKQEGIDIGKAYVNLLKKIEEMTIYIIEQDVIIKKIRDEIYTGKTEKRNTGRPVKK